MRNQTTNIINVGSDEIQDLWVNTSEYTQLKHIETLGFIAEQAEFSIVDNPYSFMSPEWIYWNCGFNRSLDKIRKKNVSI